MNSDSKSTTVEERSTLSVVVDVIIFVGLFIIAFLEILQ